MQRCCVCAADIQAILHRSQLLAIRATSDGPVALRPLRVSSGICRWMMRALSKKLVPLADRKSEADELMFEGRLLVSRGKAAIDDGRNDLSKIPEYASDGKHDVNEAKLGPKKAALLRQRIAAGEAKVQEGSKILEEGSKLLERGKSLLPCISKDKRVCAYFERLAKLAIVRDSLGSKVLATAEPSSVGTSLARQAISDEVTDEQQQRRLRRVAGNDAVVKGLENMMMARRV